MKSKIAKTVQSLVSEYGTNDTFAAELLVPDNISTKYHGFTLEQVAASENMLPELVKLKFRLS